MKRISWLVLLVVIASCIPALADGVTYNVTATFSMGPNVGTGDNAAFLMTGPNVYLIGVAGSDPFLWGNVGGSMFPAGSIGGGGMIWLPDYATGGSIGSYGANNIEMNNGSGFLYFGSFTFPTNGENFFTITVPASLSGISGWLISATGSKQPFYLSISPGELTLTYYYSSYWNSYFPDYATFASNSTVPEPGTLALMGTGAIAIFGLVRRRRGARSS